MDIHTTPMYIYTKLNIIQSRHKGVTMNSNLLFERKINFWPYGQKIYKINIANIIAMKYETIMYLHTKFHVTRGFCL